MESIEQRNKIFSGAWHGMRLLLLISSFSFFGCAFSEKDQTNKAILDIFKNSLSHENFFVRSAAVKAIGEMGDMTLVPMIIPHFKDPEPFTRMFAAESAALLKGPDTLKLLLAAGGDPEPMVRIAVVKGLDDLSTQDGKIDSIPLDKILAPFLTDPDPTVSLFAKAALVKHGHEKIIEEIQSAAQTEETRSPALVALGRTKSSRAISTLAKGLLHSDGTVRMFAAEALGEIASPETFPLVAPFVKDQDPSVRGAAANALGKIGDQRAIPILEGLVADPEISVKVSAAEGLARLGKKRLDIYQLALSDTDYAVRHFAIGSLQKTGGKDAMPLLLKGLADTAPRVRIGAVRAIGAIGGEKEIPILKGQLSDPDLSVRAYAAGNLGHLLRGKPRGTKDPGR
jgi:HEAT repeat protein